MKGFPVHWRKVPDPSSIYKISTEGADKSLARPGKKQAKTTEDFEFHISYL